MPEYLDIAARPVSGAFFLRSRPAGAFSADELGKNPGDAHPAAAEGAEDRLVWTRRNDRSTLKEALLAMIRAVLTSSMECSPTALNMAVMASESRSS